MASKNPEAPVCPACGRSNGITTETSGGIMWSHGAWRWIGNPEPISGDYSCECGRDFSESEMNECRDDGA